MTKLCIFTFAYPHRLHTMVNFHIENLFSGTSCVCSTKGQSVDPSGRAVLCRSDVQGNWSDGLLKAVVKVRNNLLKLPKYSISGTERQRIIDFLKEEQVDVILCEFGDLGAEVADSIGNIGIPIFLYYRGFDGTLRIKSPKHQKLTARAFRKAEGVFFVSKYLQDNLARYGLVHPNSYIVPSGVNTDEFRPAEKKKARFVAVGRLIEKKRPEITVQSFCDEARAHPSATLTMIGDGPALEACRDIVRKEGMEDQVSFLGDQPHDEVCRHLREAEFFLQHSAPSPEGDAEGAPRSIQEALACGCVVLSTRHAGIPELISEGETGFLVDELDVTGYRKLISDALSGSFDVERISRAARAFAVENLDNRRLTDRIEAILSASAGR
ncbi:glycosyltransferase [Roseibium aggregatum]|uniref:Glycosyltransferase n=1 Tax=Roseibium aggregatum TaxID=187304 RepID=A0A939J4W8_9HYPH|nr:glycosyltransferase [Roseibium aggregatum]MBN9672057.1 glycosyltransferase [Roseibium aggregatum]